MFTGVTFEQAMKYHLQGKEVIVIDRNSVRPDGKVYDIFPFEELFEGIEFIADVPAVENPEWNKHMAEMVAGNHPDIRKVTVIPNKENAKPEAKETQVLPSEKPRQIHQIKLEKTFFADAAAGIKPFTLRKNDRNYQVGDILEKQEYDNGKYTGRVLRQEVIYKLEDYTGLVDGYCILGVKNLEMIENQSNH